MRTLTLHPAALLTQQLCSSGCILFYVIYVAAEMTEIACLKNSNNLINFVTCLRYAPSIFRHFFLLVFVLLCVCQTSLPNRSRQDFCLLVCCVFFLFSLCEQWMTKIRWTTAKISQFMYIPSIYNCLWVVFISPNFHVANITGASIRCVDRPFL